MLRERSAVAIFVVGVALATLPACSGGDGGERAAETTSSTTEPAAPVRTSTTLFDQAATAKPVAAKRKREPAITIDGNDPTPTGTIGLLPSERGDKGDHVLALQTTLDEYGFGPGTPDGSYGRRTERAVEAFQQLQELDATGSLNAETIAAIGSYHYDGLILRAGDENDNVTELQERLAEGPFDPGTPDGVYGTATVQAVWALEKLAGLPVDGDWGPVDEHAWQLLTDGNIGKPVEQHDIRWVEVDLTTQLMKVYDPDEDLPVLISHASSGSGIAWENEEHSGSSRTPIGEFTISRRVNGWRESSLNIGRLYNPLYFVGGIALHGASSVPLYPASHGCIRLPMHIASYLPGELPNGTPIHVQTGA